jgi:uncharacterized protein (TIGR00290 family)
LIFKFYALNENQIPILFSWSGGKDSALALSKIAGETKSPIVLFTTLNIANHRVAMHGYGESLLDMQAESLGLPLKKIFIPDPCSNEEYSKIMEQFLLEYKHKGVRQVVFGDIFLEDIRKYREENLTKLEIKPLFPLWEIPSVNVALEFFRYGFKACVTCVDTSVISADFCGREYNLDLLGDLPMNVDPCGENGEFHTFVYDGPIFRFPIPIRPTEKVVKYDHFCYTDLII